MGAWHPFWVLLSHPEKSGVTILCGTPKCVFGGMRAQPPLKTHPLRSASLYRSRDLHRSMTLDTHPSFSPQHLGGYVTEIGAWVLRNLLCDLMPVYSDINSIAFHGTYCQGWWIMCVALESRWLCKLFSQTLPDLVISCWNLFQNNKLPCL